MISSSMRYSKFENHHFGCKIPRKERKISLEVHSDSVEAIENVP